MEHLEANCSGAVPVIGHMKELVKETIKNNFVV